MILIFSGMKGNIFLRNVFKKPCFPGRLTQNKNARVNFCRVAWDKLNAEEFGFDWAIEASTKMKEFIPDKSHKPIIDYASQGKAFQLAIPTPEHFLP